MAVQTTGGTHLLWLIAWWDELTGYSTESYGLGERRNKACEKACEVHAYLVLGNWIIQSSTLNR